MIACSKDHTRTYKIRPQQLVTEQICCFLKITDQHNQQQPTPLHQKKRSMSLGSKKMGGGNGQKIMHDLYKQMHFFTLLEQTIIKKMSDLMIF